MAGGGGHAALPVPLLTNIVSFDVKAFNWSFSEFPCMATCINLTAQDMIKINALNQGVNSQEMWLIDCGLGVKIKSFDKDGFRKAAQFSPPSRQDKRTVQ